VRVRVRVARFKGQADTVCGVGFGWVGGGGSGLSRGRIEESLASSFFSGVSQVFPESRRASWDA
jgi:hypothetical protein